MIEENHSLQKKAPPCPKAVSSKLKKEVEKTKINIVLDKEEARKIVQRVREEVDDHHNCVTQLKVKMEKLTSKALDELLKVKELKNIVESLKENRDQHEPPSRVASHPPQEQISSLDNNGKEHWKRALDRELEKLLIIKKLLEDALPKPPEKKETAAAPPARNGAKRILVVDDDLTTVKIITHFLQKENYVVSSSFSGVEGIKKAFKENPDLILLDIMIPDLNGFQFLSIFRKDPEYSSVPVVILSSLSEEADVLKGLQIGAVDYITKPFSPQVLVAKIKKNLNSQP